MCLSCIHEPWMHKSSEEMEKNMVVYNQDVIAKDCEPGVKRKVLTYTEELMMCEITFEKGACGNTHSHPHLQITYIVKGSFEFSIDGEKKIVHVGDSLFMPANSMHGTVALEEGILVDVFNPMRKEFLL
jgi:quercetin dioxygenase-like cupin family protein